METKGITCKVPLELHNRISEDIRESESTMSKFIEMVITEHYEKGANKTMEKSRTLAFQVSEELFQRVKHYLAAHPHMTQKSFIIELIESTLDQFEAEEAGAQNAGVEEAQEAADEPDADDTGENPDEDADGENTGTEDDTGGLEADNPEADEPDSGWADTEDERQEDPSEPDEDDD